MSVASETYQSILLLCRTINSYVTGSLHLFNVSEIDAAIFLGLLGLITSFLSWAIHMKVRHDILENNLANIKEVEALKQKVVSDLNTLNLGLVQLKSTVADTLMTMVEQRFVREDTFQTRLAAIEEKIEGVQEIIESQMRSMSNTFESRLSMMQELVVRLESGKKQ